MKFIHRPRAAGKTFAAVHHALEHGLALVVFCEQERRRIIQQYKFPPPQIFTVSDIDARHHMGTKYVGFVVDNADMVLEAWIGRGIAGITLNGVSHENSNA